MRRKQTGGDVVEIIRSHKLAWVPARKVGTTSIRAAFRGLASGPTDLSLTADRPMSPDIRWRARACWRFAVVRDPAERFLSAFYNRIHQHGDMHATVAHRAATRALGLDPKPEIDEFIDRFRTYYWANDILRRHVRPQVAYLGRDLGWYHALYPLGELDRLASDLSDRTGQTVVIPRLHRSQPVTTVDDLPSATRAKLEALIAEDRRALASVL